MHARISRRFLAFAPLVLGFLSIAGLTAMINTSSAASLQEGAPAKAAPAQEKAKNKFIGADKCKNCHSTADSGNQYHAWEQMEHAKAFATLASDKAKEIAKERNIANPQEAGECLKCHVLAYGAPKEAIKGKLKNEMGVQCESCHGPGDNHMKARMAALASGAPPEGFVALPAGEIITNVGIDNCIACHNKESPTFKKFCWPEYIAKVRHLNPKKPRTPEEKAALELVCGCGDTCACTGEGGKDDCGKPKK